MVTGFTYSRQAAGSKSHFGDSGYSLIELVATLLLMGTLAVFFTPSFFSALQKNRMSTEVNLLLTNLHLARSEAIKHRQDVVVCRSLDGINCQPSSGSRADWSSGWIMYVNIDGDKKRDADEPLIQVHHAMPDGLKLSFNQWWRLTYHSDGSAKNGTFTFCDSRGAVAARAIVVFYSGRPRVAKTKPDGNLLECG